MTREEHADYVRWLKSLPRRKDHFRMPCPECSATRSNPKDPSFSVHITREGGWAKCFHCDFAIAWTRCGKENRNNKTGNGRNSRRMHRSTVTRRSTTMQHRSTITRRSTTMQHRSTVTRRSTTIQHRSTITRRNASRTSPCNRLYITYAR